MRFVRLGPGMLFLRTNEPEKVTKFLVANLGGKELSREEAFREAGELETVVFVTGPEDKTVPGERAILVMDCPWKVMADVVNSDVPILRVDLEGIVLLMRVPDVEKALAILREKFGGEVLDPLGAMERAEAGNTMIFLTKNSLEKPVPLEDVEGALLVEESFFRVYRTLLLEASVVLFRLIPEWNELTIKLYDSTNHYEENVERLIVVVEDLDLGYIIWEGWAWDYPRPFMRVPVYKLKLLTWEDPRRVKFLLKGLEYKGYRRLCDIDVFVQGKKLSWIELGGFPSKFELAKAAREELEKALSEPARKRLKELEERLG
ncbi:hypothetical protein [Pyrococcus yayanosii]|uniref:Uncharacterized protein n=1 Tax=Pyrococcus yayanosii (strain CH1 / JCM 16557) TaxID=529709 RepID=F8AEK5_PYRYC|nr:hypothetical protein [Pyrococcus yayanosii]AEH24684.1 hypothetical protein PYCH_10010 [Pyrococcus yayanosii CH1]